MTKLRYLAIATLGIGFALIILSYNWGKVVGHEVFWSKKQAKQRTEAASVFHAMSYDTTADPQSIQAAKERFEKAQHELVAARQASASGKRAFFWLGLLISGSGLMVLLIPQRE